jgi:ADP-heptose:LPS heptosyltransferase
VLRVAVCPYAGSPEREWSMENWLELLAKVLFGELERQYEKIEVLFIGLEKNTDDYQMMKLSFGNEVIKPLLSNELIEVYAWLKSADIYVGNDSGITHLAIASGIPVIELWGLKYEVWPEYQPIAENVIIIKDDSTRRMLIGSKDKRRWMDGITIQTVYEQIVFKLKN